MILIDSSIYIALAVDIDYDHQRAVALVPKLAVEKCTSEDFVKETLTVISQRQGKAASIRFFQYLSQDTAVLPVTTERFHMGLELFLNPKINKDISLIDCIATAIYREIGAETFVTFDTHFRSLGLNIVG